MKLNLWKQIAGALVMLLLGMLRCARSQNPLNTEAKSNEIHKFVWGGRIQRDSPQPCRPEPKLRWGFQRQWFPAIVAVHFGPSLEGFGAVFQLDTTAPLIALGRLTAFPSTGYEQPRAIHICVSRPITAPNYATWLRRVVELRPFHANGPWRPVGSWHVDANTFYRPVAFNLFCSLTPGEISF